jgi:hypothetical protein
MAEDTPQERAAPHPYTEELAADICHRIAEGSSLRLVCQAEDMPSTSTVMRWAKDKDEFREQYVHACAMRAEKLADEILEIADDGSNDFMTITKGDASYEVENKEWTSRSKLRVEARKWLLSKLEPKKYGDKLDVTSGGEKVAPQFYIMPDGSRIEF